MMTDETEKPLELAKALEAYAIIHGGTHDWDCPADDTCSCSHKWINDGVNGAVEYLRGILTPSRKVEFDIDAPIVLGELPLRIAKTLIAMNLLTWRDVSRLTEADFLVSRMGRQSVNALKKHMASLGLRLEGMRMNEDNRGAAPRTIAPAAGVYFIRCGDFVKIGKTANVHQRLYSFLTAVPFDLRLAAFIPLSEPSAIGQLERELHRQFRESRHRGEWFRLDPALVEFIRVLNSKGQAA